MPWTLPQLDLYKPCVNLAWHLRTTCMGSQPRLNHVSFSGRNSWHGAGSKGRAENNNSVEKKDGIRERDGLTWEGSYCGKCIQKYLYTWILGGLYAMGLVWGLCACIQLYLCACIVWHNIALCQTIYIVCLCACMLALVYAIMPCVFRCAVALAVFIACRCACACACACAVFIVCACLVCACAL